MRTIIEKNITCIHPVFRSTPGFYDNSPYRWLNWRYTKHQEFTEHFLVHEKWHFKILNYLKVASTFEMLWPRYEGLFKAKITLTCWYHVKMVKFAPIWFYLVKVGLHWNTLAFRNQMIRLRSFCVGVISPFIILGL